MITAMDLWSAGFAESSMARDHGHLTGHEWRAKRRSAYGGSCTLASTICSKAGALR